MKFVRKLRWKRKGGSRGKVEKNETEEIKKI